MWRPEDWDGKAIVDKEVKRQEEFGMSPSFQDMVEAGADASLKAFILYLQPFLK